MDPERKRGRTTSAETKLFRAEVYKKDEENHSFDPEFMLKYNHPKYEIQKFDSSAKEIERLKKEIQMIEASNQILISELHEKIKNLTLENSELKNKCERIIW